VNSEENVEQINDIEVRPKPWTRRYEDVALAKSRRPSAINFGGCGALF